MPWAVANAVVTVASTILCTELHARFTFGSGKHAGWRQHWQSAGSAAAAYAVTSVALLILHTLQTSRSVLTEQLVLSGAAGPRPRPGPGAAGVPGCSPVPAPWPWSVRRRRRRGAGGGSVRCRRGRRR
jgi:hypothetical protein